MKIILFSAKGDEVLADTDVIEEAEEILRDYQKKGCGVVTPDGVDLWPLKAPLPDEVFILWPMSGGDHSNERTISCSLN